MTWAKMTKQRSNVYLSFDADGSGRCCQYVIYVPLFACVCVCCCSLIDEFALKFNQFILCKDDYDDENVEIQQRT